MDCSKARLAWLHTASWLRAKMSSKRENKCKPLKKMQTLEEKRTKAAKAKNLEGVSCGADGGVHNLQDPLLAPTNCLGVYSGEPIQAACLVLYPCNTSNHQLQAVNQNAKP